jgi:peptidoglycan/LPS O-acetylase OafA/YrhL
VSAENKPHHIPGFDLLRLCAALLVVVQHSYATTGAWTEEWAVRLSGGQISLGTIGVGLFFVISGYLVEQSRLRQPGLVTFFRARALRIFPALLVVVVVVPLVLGPLWTSLSFRDYFSSSQAWRYLWNVNLFAMQDSLPGVFAQNFIRTSINGSLWTLPYEIACYMLLFVVAGMAGPVRVRVWALAIVAGALYGLWLMLDAVVASPGSSHALLVGIYGLNSRDMAGFGCLFFAGSALSAAGRTLAHPFWALIASAIFVCAVQMGCARQMLPIVLPIFCVSLAHLLGSAASLRERAGDLSYGVYIWSFPMQQWLADPTGPAIRNPEIHLLLTLMVTLPVAWASWWAVERPALRLKRRSA